MAPLIDACAKGLADAARVQEYKARPQAKEYVGEDKPSIFIREEEVGDEQAQQNQSSLPANQAWGYQQDGKEWTLPSRGGIPPPDGGPEES